MRQIWLLAHTSIFYLQLGGPLKNETITELYRSIDNACWLARYTHEVDHIFIGWICDDTSWLTLQPEEINKHPNIQSPSTSIRKRGLPSDRFPVPVLAVFLFSRLLVSTNKRTKLNYFALLILTLSGTYIGSHSLFGALPLPHLYNPTDHFMDFWNVAYRLPLGSPMKWEALPSTNHLSDELF